MKNSSWQRIRRLILLEFANGLYKYGNFVAFPSIILLFYYSAILSVLREV